MRNLRTALKPAFCSLILVFSLLYTCAQVADTTIYSTAEVMPVYPGGNDSLLKEITRNVVYPQMCADSNIQGKVYLRFVVNTDGTIADLQVIKSPHPILSVAALDATLKIGKFTPGMQAGKPVKVWYSLPVNFKIKVPNAPIQTDTVYTLVDEPAEYYGGESKLTEDLSKNMVYPRPELEKDIQGRVIVKVIIDKTGLIETAVVEKSVSAGIDAEALRIIKLLAAFKPALLKNQAVKSYYTIPVEFNLQHFESTIYIGATALFTSTATMANTGGLGDNRGKFLFAYYKDGYDAFTKMIYDNMVYPPEAAKSKTEAAIRVKCAVNNQFKLVPLASLNDPDNIFTNEAFRLINLCPPFTEEMRGSSFVGDTVPIDIVFVLDKRHQWGNSAQKDEAEAEILTEQGIKLYNNAKYEKALEYFAAAIRFYSLHAKAFYNIAVTELKLNDKAGACADFKRAFLLGDLDAKNALKQTCE